MSPFLALLLFLAEPPKSLSPEAAEHNTRAMQHYDAGRYAPAVDEFYAAYKAMSDARRDREGRELLLGSMRATLLDLHDQTHEPAPLCRLQSILKEHVDALTAAYPDDPDMLEIRSARARHGEVSQQLAATPGACEPPPPPPVAAPATTPPPTAKIPPPALTASPPPPEGIPPRHLKIAGGVTLGLSVVLLGVMAYGIATEAKQSRGVAAIDDKPPGWPLTPEETEALLSLRRDALFGRHLAIGAGITAGATTALGTALLVLARRSAREKRWSASPWWSPSGVGLNVRVQLGAARPSLRGLR